MPLTGTLSTLALQFIAQFNVDLFCRRMWNSCDIEISLLLNRDLFDALPMWVFPYFLLYFFVPMGEAMGEIVLHTCLMKLCPAPALCYFSHTKYSAGYCRAVTRCNMERKSNRVAISGEDLLRLLSTGCHPCFHKEPACPIGEEWNLPFIW